MASPAQELHAARDAALRASTDLAYAMGGVKLFTAPPTNKTPPYVLHGEDTAIPSFGQCADEAEILSTVHWWSKPSTNDDQAEARAMGAAIVPVLTGLQFLPTYEIVETIIEAEEYRTDPDGSTHGIARARHLMTEIVSA